MSNFEAIRGVTWTLRKLLQDNLEVSPVAVTLVPPDVTVTGVSGRRINLFSIFSGGESEPEESGNSRRRKSRGVWLSSVERELALPDDGV